jgi:capsular polysaccharide export protein
LNSESRTFLFLQGPSSPFFERLAKALAARGHRVRRVDICFGDRWFWRGLPATHYNGRLEDWPEFIARYMAEHAVTDVLLLGDRRPHHKIAIEKAHARGAMVVCVELGYIRPDWLTLERDGMSTWSHFPNDPARIREIAARVPQPDLAERFHTSFFRLAWWDVVYNVSNVVLKPVYPHYRWHAIYHPLAEYAGWIRRLVLSRSYKRKRQMALGRVYASQTNWYLFPLQLATDYQLRDHSPYESQQEAIEEVIASFARHAPPDTHLVFKVHPLDNGLVDWHALVTEAATRHGAQGRVVSIEGGKLMKLVSLCRGVVTINSTVGTTAVLAKKPLIVLGSAVFDMEGLTYQGSLDSFWVEAPSPEPTLADDFVKALAATVQVKGGFYADDAIEEAIQAMVPRLEQRTVNEPGGFVDPPPRLVKAERRQRELAARRAATAAATADPAATGKS